MITTEKPARELQRGDHLRRRGIVEEVVEWLPEGGPLLVDVRCRGSRVVHTYRADHVVEVST